MKLAAQKRDPGTAAKLRGEGHLPGVIYNSKLNIPVSVEFKAFDKAFRSQGLSSIIDLDVGGETHEVLVKAVQMDKRRRIPLHVDFYAITAGEVVDVHVPIEYVGKAVGEREGGRLLVQGREVHIRILPRLIPQHVTVDVSELAIGDAIHVRDVVHLFPSEAEILDDEERTLVTVVPPRVIEEPEEAAAEEAEPEVIGKGGEDEDEEENEDA